MRIVHVSTVKHHPCFSDTVFLQSRNHEVVFILLRPVPDPKYQVLDQFTEDGIAYRVIDVAMDLDFSEDRKLEACFATLIGSIRPDVVHIQLFSGVNVLAVFRACGSKAVTKVITQHIHSLFCVPGVCYDQGKVCPLNALDECACDGCHSFAKVNGLTVLNYNRLRLERLKEIIALSDAVICCSRWQQETIRRLAGHKSKTRLLYYGVTIERNREYKATISREEIGSAGLDWNRIRDVLVKNGWAKMDSPSILRFQYISKAASYQLQTLLTKDYRKVLRLIRNPGSSPRKQSPKPAFGYLGSLWGLKGIDLILQCLKRNSAPDFQMVMAVTLDAANPKDVLRVKELQGNPRIDLMTNLSREDLYERFFSRIDYLIVPSVWEETGPMTLFEAFYYKVPVIISNHPSLIEKTTEGVNSMVFEDEEDLSRLIGEIVGGRGLNTPRTRANFPVQSVRRYTDRLSEIYSAGARNRADR